MDFENLVTATVVNGLPALINAGKTRFKGVELEGRINFTDDLKGQFSYARHDAKFRDFVQAFDGVPTQLAGKRYVGDRFLNKRNTALADAYTTWSAGLGYRYDKWLVRVDGENLNDERSPVAESELGDAQYYRLPARAFRLTLGTSF
jgi:iron complex outermembrane receptor protein